MGCTPTRCSGDDCRPSCTKAELLDSREAAEDTDPHSDPHRKGEKSLAEWVDDKGAQETEEVEAPQNVRSRSRDYEDESTPAIRRGRSAGSQTGVSAGGQSVTFFVINENASIEAPVPKDLLRQRGKSVDKDDLLAQIDRLVNVSYDLLAAEVLLEDVQQLLGSGSDEWAEVVASPLFEAFQRKLSYFHRVGHSLGSQAESWVCVYKDASGPHTIHAKFDPTNRYALQYRASIQIPAKLTLVMAIGNEHHLMPTWNAMVTNKPDVIGRRTAHYMVLNYQMRALGGLYQIDMLNEIRRFSDTEGGFLAEYIQSCGKDHPCYKEPLSGYKRPETQIKNVWIACGPEHTILTQVGKLVLPFPATKWLASAVGGVAGKFIVGGLVKNSLKAAEPGNPWEQLVAEDELGFYGRLDECVASTGSESRRSSETRPNADSIDLRCYFERQRLKGVDAERAAQSA